VEGLQRTALKVRLTPKQVYTFILASHPLYSLHSQSREIGTFKEQFIRLLRTFSLGLHVLEMSIPSE